MSVIEFIQFKTKLYDVIKDDNSYECNQTLANEIEDERDKYLILPPNCPQSIIVYPNDENIAEELTNKYHKLIARNLYLKYIKVDSKFEINLAYSDRKMYSRLMENNNNWLKNKKFSSDIELYTLFDGCIMEMCGLLTAAFSRFKQSNQYQILRHSF